MRIRDGCVLKEAGDIYMLIPIEQNVIDYDQIIQMNSTGYFIANKLLHGIDYEELLNEMISAYEAVGDETAIIKSNLDQFIMQLEKRNILEY